MSVVILGGNECMAGRYEQLCKNYNYKAKVFLKNYKGIQNLGTPDLMILFTSTMSHKMLRAANAQAKKRNIDTVICSRSSVSALKGILDAKTKNLQ